MTRYFFDIQDGHDLPDHTGTDLPHAEAAREHAIRIAETYVQDPAAQPVRITIRDQAGHHLDTLVPSRDDARGNLPGE